MNWEKLEKVWLEERTSKTLFPLPPRFYSEVSSYLFRLRTELEGSAGIRRELLEEELREVRKILTELFTLRTLKAVKQCLEGSVPSSQDERETKFFSELVGLLEKSRGELIERVEEETPLIEPRQELLVVLGKIPRIVGEDLRYYGPFEEGEIVSLPKATAELLVTHRFARKLHPKYFFGLRGEG
ncbi:MAG: hypothetical protein QXF20_00150 [Candidatus Hadarchaeales archaeon]